MTFQNVRWLVASIAVVLAGVSLLSGEALKGNNGDPAIERTRKQTKMLDDLYKTAIVLITEHYVKGEAPPAIIAGQLLWNEMKVKGHHEVRLLDATGEPMDEDNLPKDDFEKSAIKQIQSGKSSVDQVIENNGKRYL